MTRTPLPRNCHGLAAALALATAGLVVARATSQPHDSSDDDARTLVAIAAHELRTPLTSLHLRLDLLAEELDEEQPDLAQAREHAQRAAALSRRVVRLTNDLLHLATAGARPSRPVDLRDVAREVIGELEPMRPPAVALELRADDPVWALGDPGAVAQILRILLDNAVRFAPPGTVVTVSPGRRGRRSALTVRDWDRASRTATASASSSASSERTSPAPTEGSASAWPSAATSRAASVATFASARRLRPRPSPSSFHAGRSCDCRPETDDAKRAARDHRASSSIRRRTCTGRRANGSSRSRS